MYQKIGMIGTGNMGSAVAKAVRASGIAGTIFLANRTAEKASALAEVIGDAVVTDNRGIAADCDLIFLAVKPQIMPEVLSEIAPILRNRSGRVVLCTMAAGVSCEKVLELAGLNLPVLRIMPNTPAAIGHGVIQYCGRNASTEETEALCALLKPAGMLISIEERLIDAASAVSGCGPAFAYLFAEALADGGVACGLPRDRALVFAAGMLEGAAELILESGRHPGELKDAVCSPGGTTIQGVRKLEEAGFRGAVMDAVIAAYEKTLSLK